VKGNGIIEAKKAQAQLIKDNHKQGLKISDLLDQNDRQTIEIRRLIRKRLILNYGTVCKDCCTATNKQEYLQNKLDDAIYERDFAVYGLVMILVVTIGKILIWGF